MMAPNERVVREAAAPLAVDESRQKSGRDAAASSPRAHGWAASYHHVLFTILGFLAVGYWVVLYRWYSLLEHRSHTHFAFEKIPGQFASPILRRTELVFLGLALIYLAGYWLISEPATISRVAKLGTVVFVAGPAIVNILLYPVGALDVFNYMIELKLAYHYHENPYVVTFAAFRDDPFALPAFLVDVPLFYGPAWLLISWLPTALAGFGDVVRLLLAMKVFNLVLLVVTALAVARYQEDERRGWLAAYVFLANPLVLFEGVGNAHNDVMMTLFLVAALLALKRRSLLVGPLLALSALVKLFTAPLVPLFVVAMARGKWGARRLLLSAALSLTVVIVTVAPFWADGRMIDGLARGTVASQEMDHVSILSLAQQYARQERASEDAKRAVLWLGGQFPSRSESGQDVQSSIRRAFAGLFAALALVVAWTLTRGRGVEGAVLDTLLLFLLLLTNLYPWYLIPVVAMLALKRDAVGSVLLFSATALGLAYYPMYVWAHFNSGWPKLQVHLFLALFLTLPIVVFLVLKIGHRMVGGMIGRWREPKHGNGGQPRQHSTQGRLRVTRA